jgi:hypothetical protein
MMVKNGTRLQSQVCDTQVIIVKAGDELADLRCGGSPMFPIGQAGGGDINAEFAGGSLMGKRYVTAGGAEVLVTKAGAGTLSVGTTPLELKEAKPLPASD